MTIHSSKGLEFPVCFIIECEKNFSTNSSKQDIQYDPDLGIGFTPHDESGFAKFDSPTWRAICDTRRTKELEEEMRLLYVAMTRARERLYLVSNIHRPENKELVKRYVNIWNDLDFELKTIRLLLKSMSALPFTTDIYLRERQVAVYEASGIVPKELKTPKKSVRTSSAKPVKEKKEDTKVTTFKLYKQGLSVKDIAKERDLNQQTIVRHLAHYVAKGMIPVDEFVSDSKADAIREAIDTVGTTKGLAAIKDACPSEITYQDIVLFIASVENGDA
jgi:ATP-dependent exoDNAse (exonuclease V) beta subunit